MRRFWDVARAERGDGGYTIRLDGRVMRMPAGGTLALAGAALAQAIAAEWQAAGGVKGGEMSFDDVPLTRLAGTAQERIAPDPAPTVDALTRYAESDLLCYRAESPKALVQRQSKAWQTWLDWAALTFDAPLRVGHGIAYVPQPPDSLAALRRALAAQDAATLAGLGVIVPLTGSLVLGLAVAAGRLSAAAAHRLALLDELFQAEFWGEDSDAAARRQQVGAEIAEAARFIALAQADRGQSHP